jgi:hypothetical protein
VVTARTDQLLQRRADLLLRDLSLGIAVMRYATLTLLGLAAGTGGCMPDLSLKHRCLVDSDCRADRICVGGECRTAAGGDASSAEDAGAVKTGGGGADRNSGDGSSATDGAGVLPGVRPNIVFVTSEKLELRFESLDVADENCNAAARVAGLPGEYRAWLSTVDVDARDRLGRARGWVRPDGVPFADTLEDLVNGRILNPPALDEFGTSVQAEDDDPVATGTNPFGYHAPGHDCDGWSGQPASLTGGRASTTTDHWTFSTRLRAGVFLALTDCDAPRRIYCFGVDQSFPVAPVPMAARRAFVSDRLLEWGSDRASADAHCAAEAAEAGLGGAFLALFPTVEAAAASRFASAPGTVWVRMDGVPINAPGSDLFAGEPLLTPLNVTSKGRYLGHSYRDPEDDKVFAGASTPRAPSPGCSEWTGPPQLPPLMKFGSYTRADRWWSSVDYACSAFARIYCLEP